MFKSHTAILKANTGELEALSKLDERISHRILPLFEVTPPTEATFKRKYMMSTGTPTINYLDRKLVSIGKIWRDEAALVDGYRWAPEAVVENGEHIIAYMVSKLRALGVNVIPVVGYDRWGSAEYRAGLKGIPQREDGCFCLRLDTSAIEDTAEPNHFHDTISDILEELELDPANCMGLIDFEDISMSSASIEALISRSTTIIRELQKFGFHHYVVCGCSLPSTINLAVPARDSAGLVLRKEMLLWKTLRSELPKVKIGSGDYGVRGPKTVEKPNKNTNGKIRHTIKQQTFVVRGHAFQEDGCHMQMHGLAETVTSSRHFLGEEFSWGDRQIALRSQGTKPGNPTTWIAIDTNHHLTFAVQEVEEFELDLAAKGRARVGLDRKIGP